MKEERGERSETGHRGIGETERDKLKVKPERQSTWHKSTTKADCRHKT